MIQSRLIATELTPAPTGLDLVRNDLPTTPPPGHLRVKVLASAINPADINYLEGQYGDRPELPARLGMEGIATVIAHAPDTLPTPEAPVPAIGSQVIFIRRCGCWADILDVTPEDVLKVPTNLTPEQGALLKVNPMTALRMLSDFADLNPGDWVMQNAANSSVGECVIQIAKKLGLRTVNVVRREGLQQPLTSLGADAVIVDSKNTKDELMEITAGNAPKLGLNAVGGDSALRMMDCLANRGTMVTYGAMSRRAIKVPNGMLIFKQLRLEGFWVTKWIAAQKRARLETDYASLAQWMTDGSLRTTVSQTFPLSAYEQAFTNAKQDRRGGKVLFIPSAG
ncbi:MDR family NADPH-dependent oxidoreductase [Sulfuriroseicoccus oceanibius]|uniref:enoyl-[acyl-carrier-protein] reductase n=1 Tax=Sulfuriroseicoccus oceanibius TaxID=2707525 RepID=A0A6B3L8A3_9BACT|nr:2-enoyl thioester reductase domain-containing protein [Sulfuriroseicoccus oceanibius]QQL45963.1 2-enoyl thioester reductase domain-containing protein [Sulfuriroseicoccus oceanibius]